MPRRKRGHSWTCSPGARHLAARRAAETPQEREERLAIARQRNRDAKTLKLLIGTHGTIREHQKRKENYALLPVKIEEDDDDEYLEMPARADIVEEPFLAPDSNTEEDQSAYNEQSNRLGFQMKLPTDEGSMKVDIVDIDSFIEEVKKYDCIWNTACEEYTDSSKREAAWKTLCQTLCLGFNTMPKKEQDQIEEVAIQCWKKLMKEFEQQLQKNNLCSGGSAHDQADTSWPYLQKLMFLQDQFTSCGTSTNSDLGIKVDAVVSMSQDDFSNAQQSISVDISAQCNAGIEETSTVNPAAPAHMATLSNVTSSKRKLSPEVEFGTKSLNLQKEKQPLTMNKKLPDPNDDDVGFFNSLLPTVKTLSLKDKLIFRMKMQQTLYGLVFPESREPPTQFVCSPPNFLGPKNFK